MANKLTRRQVIRCFGAGALASAVPVSMADYSSSWIEIVRTEIALPNWDAKGFRLVVLSDLHVNSARQTALAVKACNIALRENGDAIAIPGDFVNFSDPTRLRNIRIALAPLRNATCPIIATMGNHDYATNRPQAVIETIAKTNVRMLRNEAFEHDGVTFGGLDDALARRHHPEFLRADGLSKSLISLLHEPDFVSEMPGHVSLQVSGHSHGGQICLPGGTPLLSNYGAKTYYAGYYPDARVPLYVTRGVGTTGMQVRVFCRPEVTVLTLNGAA